MKSSLLPWPGVATARTIRALTTEVILALDNGMPVSGALNFDHPVAGQADRNGPALSRLPESRWPEVRPAPLPARGLDQEAR